MVPHLVGDDVGLGEVAGGPVPLAQVLDIGIVLPAFIVGGISLVRGRPLGFWLVPVMLTFGVA